MKKAIFILILCSFFVGCALKNVERKGKCYQTKTQCYTSIFGCEEEVIDEICYEKVGEEEVPVRTK